MPLIKKKLEKILQQPVKAGLYQPWLNICLQKIKKTKAGKAKDCINLLALSAFRLKNDLDILKQDDCFNIYELDIKWQDRITALFGNIKTSGDGYGKLPKGMDKHMQKFVAKLLKRLNIHVVLSANFWYLRDMPWGRAIHNIGIPYIVLFRECLKTRKPHQQWVSSQCQKIGRYYGSHIVVHNEKMKQVLTEGGFAHSDQVHVLGCMRMDGFIKQMNSHHNRYQARIKNQVTAFSFTTGIGLNDLGVLPFKENLFLGWYRLFESFHCVVARLALAHPDVKFIIKTKWAGSWFELIDRAMQDNGIDLKLLNNLEITSERNPHQLIFDSRLVMGFSSSTLLEAALADKPVLVPNYEECNKDLYKQRIQLLDLYHLFDVANSEAELYHKASYYIENNLTINQELQQERQKGFEKWLSSINADATERYTHFIKKQAAQGRITEKIL